MLVGRSLEELRTYRPSLPAAPDFDDFWATTLASMAGDGTPTLSRWSGPITQFEVFDVTVAGYNGDPIRGWFIRPRNLEHEVPCVVTFEGYGGGRGLPQEWLFWPSCGYAVLVMDTRGQGSGHRRGDTPDGAYAVGNHAPGFMTHGIESRETYFYRRVYTDAVCFVRAAAQLPGVRGDRLIVAGGSQGGGISIAAAGLSPQVFAAMPDVPFLCHMAQAMDMTDGYPYHEIVQFLRGRRDSVEATLSTLAYFDGMNFAARATAPALFSVGMHDPICPPDTVFAAFNHWAGPHEIEVWRYSTHEGGGVDQHLKQAAWLEGLMARG